MTQHGTPTRPTAQPSLNVLMARFLAARAAQPADAADAGEVVPHEVAGGFRPTANATWDEALAAFRLFGVEAEQLPCPADWAAFAALDRHAVAVPLAAGLFPQRVRQVPALTGGHAAEATDTVAGFAGLRGWLVKALRSQSATTLLVAAGVAAGLGDWSEAEAALRQAEPLCVGLWRAAWVNQHAALEWLRGRHAEAAAAWAQLDADTVAAFNRGMAELFAGQTGEANAALEQAADTLPDSSGWRHLAKLYQSLAQARLAPQA
jgi:hypothetical protein